MTNFKLSAGDIIEARCTRCRKILNHRIVAMVDDKVARVECNTCNGVHNYHAPPVAKESKAGRSVAGGGKSKVVSTPRVAKKDPAEIEREEWASLYPTLDLEKAFQYDMTARYRVKNLIQHPSFGLGIVKVVIAPNKMQVLFESGVKLLRCQ